MESKLDNDMPTLKIELAGKQYSCIIKINEQRFCALLDFGAEVSLIHTGVYNCLKPKAKKQSAFLQFYKKSDSIDIDECASLTYKIGRKNKNVKSL